MASLPPGRKFTVISDQRSLKYLIELREVQPQYQRCHTKLLGYDFEILYQSRLFNKAADALSCVPPVVECKTLTVPSLISVEKIHEEVLQDRDLCDIMKKLQTNPSSLPKYSFKQGQLLVKDRLVLSKNSSLIPNILHTYHDSVLGGHFGFGGAISV